jgi:pseudouridine-5'-phosphate glycosidase
MHLAHRVGIHVVATGGIGGAHRGANESFDVSAGRHCTGEISCGCSLCRG